MAYASVDELRAIWPGLPSDQTGRATALLEDAAVRIDAYATPAIPMSEHDEAVRRMVSREMVMFVMANDTTPGVAQESRTVGPFSQSFTFDRPGRTLMLTDEHKRMLRDVRQTAFTVLFEPQPPSGPWGWLP